MPAPTFNGIEVTADGARGELHLNLPEKLNPLSIETLHELAEAARWLDGHPDLKVVVVAGRGRAFSAGADVAAFAGASEGSPTPREAADAGRLMADAIERMAAVTIAKLHGHCVGGGPVLRRRGCNGTIATSSNPTADASAWSAVHPEGISSRRSASGSSYEANQIRGQAVRAHLPEAPAAPRPPRRPQDLKETGTTVVPRQPNRMAL